MDHSTASVRFAEDPSFVDANFRRPRWPSTTTTVPSRRSATRAHWITRSTTSSVVKCAVPADGNLCQLLDTSKYRILRNPRRVRCLETGRGERSSESAEHSLDAERHGLVQAPILGDVDVHDIGFAAINPIGHNLREPLSGPSSFHNDFNVSELFSQIFLNEFGSSR